MNMHVSVFLNKGWVFPLATGIVGLSGGIGLGYILGKKKDENKQVDTDNGQLELNFKAVSGEAWEQIKEEAEERSAKIQQPLREREMILEEREAELNAAAEEARAQEFERVNVFRNEDTDWDYEAELSARDPDEPYVIHQDEFMNDEMDFTQEVLTYYAGDNMMADGEDTPIYGFSGLMGQLRFGHGTTDPNVVYIRNEKIHMEWEILRHQGRFDIEVLGSQLENELERDKDELRHSVMKFRQE